MVCYYHLFVYTFIKEFTIVYLKQPVFLEYTVLQLFCIIIIISQS
jgi:hypothetical protein